MKKQLITAFFICISISVFCQKIVGWGAWGGIVDQKVKQVATGKTVTAVVKQDGTIATWGSNEFHQLEIPPNVSNIIKVAVNSHTVVLKENGTVVAWGDNNYNKSTIPDTVKDVVDIVTTDYHTLLQKKNGDVHVYSDQYNSIIINGIKAIAGGQFGYALVTRDDSVIISNIPSFNRKVQAKIKSIAITDYQVVVVTERDSLITWGNSKPEHIPPSNLTKIKNIVSYFSGFIAQKEDRTIVSWGENIFAANQIPVDLGKTESIAAGAFSSAALKEDGSVVVWGYYPNGQLSIPAIKGEDIKELAIGEKHFVALRKDGTVFAWGNNEEFQLNVPQGLNNVKAIAAGKNHTVALKEDGSVVSWGSNNFGQVNTLAKDAIAIDANSNYSAAFMKNGAIIVWGDMYYGNVNYWFNVRGMKSFHAGISEIVALSITDDVYAFSRIDSLFDIKEVVGDYGTIAALGKNGKVKGSIKNLFPAIDTLKNIRSIAIGKSGLIALSKSGKVIDMGNVLSKSTIPMDLKNVFKIYAHFNTSIAFTGPDPEDLRPKNRISGNVFKDSILIDCKLTPKEKGRKYSIVKAEPGPYYASTDLQGNYTVLTDTGMANYTLSQILYPHPVPLVTNSCTPFYNINFRKQAGDTCCLNFANTEKQCALLTINIENTRRRRCLKGLTYVKYCNDGNITSPNAQVKVRYAEYVNPISSVPSWNSRNEKELIYNVAALNPHYCATIIIKDSVICHNEAIRGLTQCTEAFITPESDCLPIPVSIDGSLIEVKGSCNAGVANIEIINSGSGDMSDSSSFTVYINDTVAIIKSFKLQAGKEVPVSITALGKNVKAEVNQNAGIISRKKPGVILEGCVTSISNLASASRNLVTTSSFENILFNQSSTCLPITDSYDPNDKLAFPSGMGIDKRVKAGTLLHYTIRFQNTGSDTAYNILIVDSLTTHLDISTLRVENSSHPYVFNVKGKVNPVLEFRLTNINLPDSTSNLLKSQGFVSFSINTLPNLPDEIKIKNKAAIYFDFNSAVITNEVFHTTGIKLVTDYEKKRLVTVYPVKVLGLASHNFDHPQRIEVYPNPSSGIFYILPKGEKVSVQIADVNGKIIRTESEWNTDLPFDQTNLINGVYYIKVSGNQEKVFKFIKH